MINASKRTSKRAELKSSNARRTARRVSAGPLDMIHKKIKQFASDNPEAEEYCINTELEAGELLLYMSAAIDHRAREVHKDNRRLAQKYRYAASVYKGHFNQESALPFIANGELKLFGLTLVTTKGNTDA